ncbi:MAG: ComEC/Rec2 family competence protein [Planctomycetota bacterium]
MVAKQLTKTITSAVFRDRSADRSDSAWKRLGTHGPLVFVAASAAVGVLVASSPVGGSLLWFGLILTSLLSVWIRRDRVRLLVAMLLVMSAFGLRYHVAMHQAESASVLAFVDDQRRPSVVLGTIESTPRLRPHPLASHVYRRDQSPWQTRLQVRLKSMRIGSHSRNVEGAAVVWVDGRCDQLMPGTEVRLLGSISRFTPPRNPGAVDFRPSQKQNGVHVQIHVDGPDQVEIIRTEPFGYQKVVALLAGTTRDGLMTHVSPQRYPLALALVIGQRDQVDDATRDQLLVTGTAHLLSVSGLHLAIIVLMARTLGSFFGLPTWLQFVWLITVCGLYIAITGGRPPVVRAGILVAIWIVSMLLKKPSQPLNTLALAGLFLLLYNPLLLFSMGVQLSFLAVATLLTCGRPRVDRASPVEETLQRDRRLDDLVRQSHHPIVRGALVVRDYLWLGFWYSLCVTAISTPLVWYHFHVVSPISAVVNVPLGLLMIVALGSGVLTAILAPLTFVGAQITGFVCDRVLWLMKWLIEFAAWIPGGHAWLPAPPAWWVVVFYVGILVLFAWQPPFPRLVDGRSSRNGWGQYSRCVWVGTWLLIAWMMATTPVQVPDNTTETTFVDVGHGTSVVLRSDDSVWLYDCGRLGNEAGDSREIDSVLWSLGVTRLDGIVLSHADADHFNALPGLLQRFFVDKIVTPPGMLSENEPALVDARAAIERFGVPVHEVASGDRVAIGNHQADILHPPSDRLTGSDNANSLVVRWQTDAGVMILPGDLEEPGTTALMDQPRPPAGGVLMAPHHGSLASGAEKVLSWARPGAVIVSGGKRSGRPEVTEFLSAHGSMVYCTNTQGAIRVRMSPDATEVRTWLDDRW